MWQSIITLVLFLLITGVSFAQEISPSDPSLTSPTPTSQNVQYELPYPGLLPDNPLYPIKAFRDKFISIFITDPLKQAQFDLLQADKRLNAAYLLQKESNPKEQLIITTLSKSENYFEDALGKARGAKKQGRSVIDFAGNLSTAQAKHYEMIMAMGRSGSITFRKNIEKNKTRVEGFSSVISKLKL